MPSINKIRVTNVVFEDGAKRFNDEIFRFDGHNGAILLENGGGKTVFIHSVLQAVLPHAHLGERKIKETLQLEDYPAHIAIEWIDNENPRRYVTTAVSLYIMNNRLHSIRYVYEYGEGDPHAIEHIPFSKKMTSGTGKRPIQREELIDYYATMKNKTHNAVTFLTITEFQNYIEEHYQIINNEWENILKINQAEGGIEKFFENCRTTVDLYDRLLIPTVEESIINHNKTMFADLFEKQRTGFHTYKKLTASIQEHQLIQTELDKYVDRFKIYADKQTAYEAVKQRAKGFWKVIVAEKINMEQAARENQQAEHVLEENKHTLAYKQISYEILVEELAHEKLNKYYHEKLAIYEEASELLQKQKQTEQALIYARLNKERNLHQETMEYYEAELATYEQDQDLSEVKSKLEAENRKLHGYYLMKLDSLKKEETDLILERNPLERERDHLKQTEKELVKYLTDLERQCSEQKGELKSLTKQSNQIKRGILANPDQEDVKTEQTNWIKREQYLDEEIIRLKQTIKTNELSIEQAENKAARLNQQLNKTKLQQTKTKSREQHLQNAHDQLIKQLATIRPDWGSLENIYLRENAVYERLLAAKNKLTLEQERLLDQERLAKRFVDDYAEQTMFFGDSFLNNQLLTWKNQYDYLISGVEYFDQLLVEQQESFPVDVLWPLLIITTATTKPVLIKRIKRLADKLQFPITVLTIEEVSDLRTNKQEENWIVPDHWENNLDPNQFTKWKDKIASKAETVEQARKEKEVELAQLQQVISSFETFFSQYPAEHREGLISDLNNLTKQLATYAREIKLTDTSIKEFNKEQSSLNEDIREYDAEKDNLAGRIVEAVKYLHLIKDSNTRQMTIRKKDQLISDKKNEQRQLKRDLTRFEDEISDIAIRINRLNWRVQNVDENRDYQEVKSTRPLFTEEAEVVIIARRKKLILEKEGIQTSYAIIVERRNTAKSHIERLEQNMQSMRQQNDQLQTDVEFPLDGAELLTRLQQQINEQKLIVTRKSKAQSQAQVEVNTKAGVIKEKLDQFNNSYPDQKCYIFTEATETIQAKLTKELQDLTNRADYITKEKQRIAKALNNINEAKINLGNFQEKHQFQSTIIKSEQISERERTEFSYQRLAFVEKLTNALKINFDKVAQGKDDIAAAKVQFRIFCNKTITNVKLRQMAIEGIEHKTTYEDVLTHRGNMLTSVERADKIARDYISENDREIQAFINSIHNHLQNLVEQLKEIPRKTRVHIGERRPEIFSFTIPEWTEEEGKERIRTYIDWILDNLESDQYLNEHGEEDSGKVRKQIETWLDSKQLLQQVIANEAMKVRCRKVTNDNRVTSKTYSWEKSNQWSGGEKWSKNMTLFLGILNFVAEKKQYHDPTKKQRRTVILDNPFGAASNEHVLNPVFFIAEKLNFQIIALTAHAEGKYLRDYFPITYSCRLRQTGDPSKKVMEKKKHIRKAYFKDHDPVAMNRLEEREQIELNLN